MTKITSDFDHSNILDLKGYADTPSKAKTGLAALESLFSSS